MNDSERTNIKNHIDDPQSPCQVCGSDIPYHYHISYNEKVIDVIYNNVSLDDERYDEKFE